MQIMMLAKQNMTCTIIVAIMYFSKWTEYEPFLVLNALSIILRVVKSRFEERIYLLNVNFPKASYLKIIMLNSDLAIPPGRAEARIIYII